MLRLLLLVDGLVLNALPPACLQLTFQIGYSLLELTLLIDNLIDSGVGLLLCTLVLTDQAVHLFGLRLVLHIVLVDQVLQAVHLQVVLVLIVI